MQTVHSVREIKQEREQMVLMQMQSEIQKAVERIGQIEQMRFQALENYSQRMRAGERLDALELELSSNHITSLDRMQREAQQLLEQAKQTALEQGKVVAAAGRQVKITEKLRETQQTRHKHEMSKIEQNALDEIVCANFARQMS